jgi:hypothetical protein
MDRPQRKAFVNAEHYAQERRGGPGRRAGHLERRRLLGLRVLQAAGYYNEDKIKSAKRRWPRSAA